MNLVGAVTAGMPRLDQDQPLGPECAQPLRPHHDFEWPL